MLEQRINRRQLLAAMAAGAAPLLAGCQAATRSMRDPTQMGVVVYSLNLHRKYNWAGRYAGVSPGLAFLEESCRLGAGGIQFPFGPDDVSSLKEIRRRADNCGMRVEGILEMPASDADLPRFAQMLAWATAAGAKLGRAAVIPGRRYEQFNTLDEVREAERQALASLRRAEPLLARHRFRLAVENHKDQLVSEKLQMLWQLGSEYVGVCVDVGNNIALAEEPMEAVRNLAPSAFTVHLKDHTATSYPEGYLLWDAALGDGFLDLPGIVDILRRVAPRATFNLEVITRDPLQIPIHTDAYWATLPGRRQAASGWLAEMLRKSPAPKYAQPLAALSPEQQLALERSHCGKSLAYAKERLNL